ncbi:hypothetical protein [Teretinema zuelzerae]|uniref:hypothetical protein n=1 Tax=Teretinema zuelzerae TaxID=156 RepID=UPI0038B51102
METVTGRGAGTKRFRALVTTTRKTPPKKAEKLNPLGIYIEEYNSLKSLAYKEHSNVQKT